VFIWLICILNIQFQGMEYIYICMLTEHVQLAYMLTERACQAKS